MTKGFAMRYAALAVLIALCTGCATPPNFKTSPEVPASRVLDKGLTVQRAGTGQIHVVRWSDAWGTAVVDARVYVDGKHVVNIDKGESFRAYLPPGKHTVGVKLLGLDSVEQPVRSKDVEVVAGQTNEFEVFWAGSAFDIQPRS